MNSEYTAYKEKVTEKLLKNEDGHYNIDTLIKMYETDAEPAEVSPLCERNRKSYK